MHVRNFRFVAAAALAAGIGTGILGFIGTAGAAPPPGPPAPPPGPPAPPPGPPGSGHALFLETDQSAGNQVLAYTRGADGTVSLAGTYATSGLGTRAATASADRLASQGGLALVNGGKNLVAVNAGSGTISLFSVNGASLSLTQTLPSGGQFPASVAADGPTIAVLNSGGTGTVAEFRLQGNHLAPIPGSTRSLGLTNTNPPNFLRGAGQVGFTPDGRHLVVTTKASSSSYEVFNIGPGGNLAPVAVVTPSATPVPFAFSFDAAGHLVGAEAGSSNVSTYTVNADGTLTHIGSVGDGGAALCWIAGVNGTFYGSNAGSGTVSSFNVNPAGVPLLAQAVAATTHPGTTDAAASPDGKFLYVESGGSGAFDAFAVNGNGSLSPIETVWNVPVGSEGIAVS
jgi:6-phosphogluconolactonase (cycloisomerase 2 family)